MKDCLNDGYNLFFITDKVMAKVARLLHGVSPNTAVAILDGRL
jgi:hypothetical protein